MSSLTRLIAASGFTLAGLIGGAQAQSAQPGSCLFTHFKTKSPACVDQVLGLSAVLAPGAFNAGMPPIGFLAEIFLRSPTERARILAAPADRGAIIYILTALLRAGLTEEAERLAAQTNGGSILGSLKAMRLSTLPGITAAGTVSAKDTELLAGAYGASGNRRYLDVLLTTFEGADEKAAGIGLRLGLLTSKWGASFAPAGHRSQILKNFCTEYDCKAKPPETVRILGIMAVYGAVSTIAREDAGTKKVLEAAFAKRKPLKAILAAEQASLNNYGMALTVSRLLTGGGGRERRRPRGCPPLDRDLRIVRPAAAGPAGGRYGGSAALEHRPGYRIQDDVPCFCAASSFSESRKPPFGTML